MTKSYSDCVYCGGRPFRQRKTIVVGDSVDFVWEVIPCPICHQRAALETVNDDLAMLSTVVRRLAVSTRDLEMVAALDGVIERRKKA